VADLARWAPVGGAAPARWAGPGVALVERPFAAKLRLQAPLADLPALAAAAGAALPSAPNSVAGDDPWLLWRGPGDWLAYSLARPAAEFERALRALLPVPGAAALYATDLTSGLALVEVAGPLAIELLLRDCGLDLEGGAVPPGGCATGALAQLTVTLHRPSAESWRLFVDRSAARHLWEWLVDSAGLLPPESERS
jgi:heterotetrameric sarcosine oxidase gamma subunit